MKKRLLSVALIGALSVGFSGCGASSYSTKLKFSEVQENINSYSEEDKIKAVSYFWKNIKGIKNPSLAVQKAAIKSHGCQAFEVMQNPDSTIVLDMLPNCGYAIKHIKNPTEEQQLLAVKQKGYGYYQNPILEIIKNPSEKVQLEAIKHNGKSIKYIKNPTEEMQIEAMKNYYGTVDIIKKPNKNVRKAAFEYQPYYAVQKYKNLTEKEKLQVVKNKASAIEYIKNPTEEMQVIAVEKNYWNLLKIKNPSEKAQLLAVKENKYLCEKIKNPTKSVLNECPNLKLKEQRKRELTQQKQKQNQSKSSKYAHINKTYNYSSNDKAPQKCLSNQRLSIASQDWCSADAKASGEAWAFMAQSNMQFKDFKDKQLGYEICKFNTTNSVWSKSNYFSKVAFESCLNKFGLTSR